MATPKIQIMSDGEKKGTSFPLTQGTYTLGRSDTCDICIPDSTVSGHHCTLFKQEGGEGYYLRDEGSTNGTRINESPLEPGVEIELHNGDLFKVGSVELLYDSGEGRRMDGSHTVTVVNLDQPGTSERTAKTNLNNLDSKSTNRRRTIARENPLHKYIFWGILGILGICVIGALGYCILNMLSSK